MAKIGAFKIVKSAPLTFSAGDSESFNMAFLSQIRGYFAPVITRWWLEFTGTATVGAANAVGEALAQIYAGILIDDRRGEPLFNDAGYIAQILAFRDLPETYYTDGDVAAGAGAAQPIFHRLPLPLAPSVRAVERPADYWLKADTFQDEGGVVSVTFGAGTAGVANSWSAIAGTVKLCCLVVEGGEKFRRFSRSRRVIRTITVNNASDTYNVPGYVHEIGIVQGVAAFNAATAITNTTLTSERLVYTSYDTRDLSLLARLAKMATGCRDAAYSATGLITQDPIERGLYLPLFSTSTSEDSQTGGPESGIWPRYLGAGKEAIVDLTFAALPTATGKLVIDAVIPSCTGEHADLEIPAGTSPAAALSDAGVVAGAKVAASAVADPKMVQILPTMLPSGRAPSGGC